MIELSRLNGKRFFLNPELIETVEAMPDTTIRLTNGRTYVVKEDCREVQRIVIQYQQVVLYGKPPGPTPPGWNVISSEPREK